MSTFSTEAEKFKEKFQTEGPASVGTDLDKGLSVWIDIAYSDSMDGMC